MIGKDNTQRFVSRAEFERAGDFFKAKEKEQRTYFERDNHIVIRVDGRAFHTYTKKLERPFSGSFLKAMQKATQALCNEISGVRFAYTQSDEISLYIKARGEREELFMGGEHNKLVSLASAIATAGFLEARFAENDTRIAHFDARVLTLDTTDDVREYFKWRHDDAVKNSVSMLAHSEFGHKKLLGVNTIDKLAMLEEAGKPWDEISPYFRFGTMFHKHRKVEEVSYTDKRDGQVKTVEAVRSPFVSVPAVREKGNDKFLWTLDKVFENGETSSTQGETA